MKRNLVTILVAVFLTAFLNTPALAQEATATPLETDTGTSVPQIEITPAPPVEGSTPTEFAESTLDTFIALLGTIGVAVVGIVLIFAGALVYMARINAKAVADNIPLSLALKILSIGEIGAKLTPDTKDDAEIAAAKQRLIEAYERLTQAVDAQAADMQRDASHTPRG